MQAILISNKRTNGRTYRPLEKHLNWNKFSSMMIALFYSTLLHFQRFRYQCKGARWCLWGRVCLRFVMLVRAISREFLLHWLLYHIVCYHFIAWVFLSFRSRFQFTKQNRTPYFLSFDNLRQSHFFLLFFTLCECWWVCSCRLLGWLTDWLVGWLVGSLVCWRCIYFVFCCLSSVRNLIPVELWARHKKQFSFYTESALE